MRWWASIGTRIVTHQGPTSTQRHNPHSEIAHYWCTLTSEEPANRRLKRRMFNHSPRYVFRSERVKTQFMVRLPPTCTRLKRLRANILSPPFLPWLDARLLAPRRRLAKRSARPGAVSDQPGVTLLICEIVTLRSAQEKSYTSSCDYANRLAT